MFGRLVLSRADFARVREINRLLKQLEPESTEYIALKAEREFILSQYVMQFP